MRYWLKVEHFKSLMLALMLLGVIILLFGLYRFATLSQAQSENAAYQIRQQNSAVQLQNQTDAQLLLSADLKLREIQRQRNEAAVIMGIGVVLTAAVWLGSDVLRGRARRAASTPQT